MRYVTVAAAELNQIPLDWPGNLARARRAIARARDEGARIVCLPELCLTGYGCEDAFHSPGLVARAWAQLHAILPDTRGLVVSVGLPVLYRNALYNAAALCVDGEVRGFVPKRHLAGDGLHYEPRWFKPWPAHERATLEYDGTAHPIGDLWFDVGGLRIGFEICEDAWVAERPGAQLSLRGVDVILNPSASHFAFGKIAVRRGFVTEGSRAFGATYVYANLLGNESGRAIYDGGSLVASGGRILAQGRRFSFDDVRTTTATVDVDLTRMSQARTASFRPRVGDDPCSVRVPFEWPKEPVHARPAEPLPAWESGPDVKEEELTRAVALALYDYGRKSHSRGFVVSLSGGADSAVCACLVGLMAEFASREIGLERVAKSFRAGPVDSVRALVRRLLVTAYQATRHSGDVTRDAARAVADGVGSEHLELDVDALVAGYRAIVEEAIGRPLTWEQDDITLQNVQARTRSPSVWMLANIRGSLLLATSNRSEAAVGYATMDGDTSGGLSPIAGIDKNYLRRWLRWLEAKGPEGIGPMPALAAVNRQQPTAELRPSEKKQTDEDDLMPYDFLDVVERGAVRDRRTPAEILTLTRQEFPQHPLALQLAWIERFFRLFTRNQWKRERFAPSFHLDDESLDPKTWCRFPILSGGYETELEEMRREAERG